MDKLAVQFTSELRFYNAKGSNVHACWDWVRQPSRSDSDMEWRFDDHLRIRQQRQSHLSGQWHCDNDLHIRLCQSSHCPLLSRSDYNIRLRLLRPACVSDCLE